jgi:CheY-like chemotaxis protein
MAERILVVDPDRAANAAMVALLTAERYDVTDAADVVSALARLNAANVDLLITIIRPGVFNGLPLVLRGATENARMVALIVHDSLDPATDLTLDPQPIGGAMHVARSTDRGRFLRQVADALAARERRRWSRATLLAPIAVQTAGGRARVLDVSYGGLKLEFPLRRLELPGRFHLELASVGLLVDVRRVWSKTLADAVRCGAELQAASLKRVLRWRRLVDSLRARLTPESDLTT